MFSSKGGLQIEMCGLIADSLKRGNYMTIKTLSGSLSIGITYSDILSKQKHLTVNIFVFNPFNVHLNWTKTILKQLKTMIVYKLCSRPFSWCLFSFTFFVYLNVCVLRGIFCRFLCLFVCLFICLFVCLFVSIQDNVLVRKGWTESFTNLTQHVPGGSLQSSCRSQNVPGAPPAASFLHRPYVHWPWQHWPFWVQATFSFRQWTQRNMWQYLPEK